MGSIPGVTTQCAGEHQDGWHPHRAVPIKLQEGAIFSNFQKTVYNYTYTKTSLIKEIEFYISIELIKEIILNQTISETVDYFKELNFDNIQECDLSGNKITPIKHYLKSHDFYSHLKRSHFMLGPTNFT